MNSGGGSPLSDGAVSQWVLDLLQELPSRFDSPTTELTLSAVIGEAIAWARTAPADAWQRQDNINSLIADAESSLTIAGDRVRREISESSRVFIDSLGALASTGSGHRQALLPAVSSAAGHLLRDLIKPAVRALAWDDLIAAAQESPPDLPRIQCLIRLLVALLQEAKRDPDEAISGLRARLDPSSGLGGEALLEMPSIGTFEEHQISLCRDHIARPPGVGDCVVWLTYDDARLATQVQAVGAVTLYESDWAIPNARSEGGQDSDHRRELLNVIEHWNEVRDQDPQAGRTYQVLARVDLGRRSSYQGFEDAAAIVNTILGVVLNRSGAPSWPRGQHSCLLVDGVVLQTRWGVARRTKSSEPEHYGQNGTATALSDYAKELGDLFASGALPGHLSEALRLIGEAGQVDSREHQLNGIATIAEQTVVVLQASAVEHVGSLAKMKVREHDDCLLAGWPVAQWRRQITEAIGWCLQHRGGLDPLFQAVCLSQFGHWSFTAAYENRADLAAAAPSPTYQHRALVLFESLGDPVACRAMLQEFEAQSELLNARLRRVRNALVHGNPVTEASVGSVRALSRFKADVALELAIQGVAQDKSPKDLFYALITHRDAGIAELTAGVSMNDQWRRGGTK